MPTIRSRSITRVFRARMKSCLMPAQQVRRIQATYSGTGVLNGAEAQDVVMSVSNTDKKLLGVLYNPRPANTTQEELDRIEDARVRCGNQLKTP